MPEISINVTNKIAQLQGNPSIVCGNSDYTITFDFDEEWDAFNYKTAHFSFIENGIPRFYEVLFSGDTVSVPAVWNTCEILAGVYAGDIHTTTPASIPCVLCITEDEPVHPDPPPDVYEQLRRELESLDSGGGATLTAFREIVSFGHPPEIMDVDFPPIVSG